MNLTVASSPHIRGDFRTSRLMLDVVIALIPALIVGTVVLGFRALLLTAVSMASAVAAEWLYSVIAKKRNTLPDCSALVTGMLFALTLPAATPYWIVILGSVFAIVFVKLLCGGLGQNVFNPALAARAFVLLLFPAALTRYSVPGVDGVSTATPLHHMVMPALPEQSVLDMFLGNCPGSIGELSALALLIGGGYLVIRKVISVRIPAAYLGTVAALTFVFHKTDSALLWMLYSLFSGGVMLGAVFMATDYATSPVTPVGQIVYGIGCGVLTVLFRYFGLFPEGVTYAILLMNACAWAIDRLTPPRRFGVKKGGNRDA
ncbi:MAG: RnfABCDGE type electron transport complex subunit D [Faecousia sp.]